MVYPPGSELGALFKARRIPPGSGPLPLTIGEPAELPPDGGWWVNAYFVGTQHGRRPFWQPWALGYRLDHQGRLWPKKKRTFILVALTSQYRRFVEEASEEARSTLMEGVSGYLYPFALATTLLHCKNVTARRVSIPTPLKKKAERRGLGRYTYSVLEIEPLRQLFRKEAGQGPGISFTRALHICRGHFKDYRDGQGLFGKFKGLYWWDQSVRGDVHAGVHVKDYVIKGAEHVV